MTEPKYGRYQLLRKKAFELQKDFFEELCSDGENETPLQKQFGFFLWEIDEKIREQNKEIKTRKFTVGKVTK